jgi:hypothetical protein
MTEQETKEKEYLLNVSRCTLPKKNPFVIRVENDKEMFVISPSTSSFANELDKISQYKTLLDTVGDLTTKISFSLQNAIEDTYSDEVLNQFDMLYTGGEKEWSAYYNIENALFRIEALWDILAQIYNIKYSLEKDIKNVYHTHIFSKQDRWIKKYWASGVPSEINAIANYFEEADNTDIIGGMWKGNYRYVNSLRNDMTHKFSISQSAFSSYAFALRSHPSFILKRVSECFSVLQDFIYEACENIMEENEHFEKC